MVNLETVDELAEWIADKMGIYGIGQLENENDHPDDCECRICFVIDMVDRIRTAVFNETLLEGPKNYEFEPGKGVVPCAICTVWVMSDVPWKDNDGNPVHKSCFERACSRCDNKDKTVVKMVWGNDEDDYVSLCEKCRKE